MILCFEPVRLLADVHRFDPPSNTWGSVRNRSADCCIVILHLDHHGQQTKPSETWYDGHIWQSAKSIEKYGKVPSQAIHDVMQVPALPVPREAADQNGQVSDSQCQQLLS